MKTDIINRLLRALALPEDTLGTVPRITLTGDSGLRIENHRGLVVYAREHIAVSSGRFLIQIQGEGLELQAMDRNEIWISGQIFSLALE